MRSVPTYDAPRLDMERVRAEDEARALLSELSLYGRQLPMGLSTTNDGAWSSESGHVWRAHVRSVGALATELFFDGIRVPDGATLSVLDDKGQLIHGPFTSIELGYSGYFTTPLVSGESSIVEYRVPLSVQERGELRIAHVGHAYRDVDDGPCHVDVACSPEGDAWHDAASSVVRISVVVPAGTGWCTGTLVNNVRQDCTPYVLTAWHCGATSSTADLNQYKFYFNFSFSGCGGGAYSTAQYRTGAQLKAFSNDNSGNAGSDFMLLRLNSDIPASYDPYYAGWDATPVTTSSSDGVCLHHPTSAPKKVSTYTQTLYTGHWASSTGLMSHWRVYWTSTPNGYGVTESGSSGGALWKLNSNGDPLVIGTLSGSTGGLSCTNPTQPSYFGKMSYHWTNNPNTPIQKLDHWLDPDDTGTLQLTGTYAPCSAVANVPEFVENSCRIWPNPAGDVIHVQLDRPMEHHARLLMIDVTGRAVLDVVVNAQKEHSFDTSDWANGFYAVSLFQYEAPIRTSSLIIAH